MSSSCSSKMKLSNIRRFWNLRSRFFVIRTSVSQVPNLQQNFKVSCAWFQNYEWFPWRKAEGKPYSWNRMEWLLEHALRSDCCILLRTSMPGYRLEAIYKMKNQNQALVFTFFFCANVLREKWISSTFPHSRGDIALQKDRKFNSDNIEKPLRVQ